MPIVCTYLIGQVQTRCLPLKLPSPVIQKLRGPEEERAILRVFPGSPGLQQSGPRNRGVASSARTTPRPPPSARLLDPRGCQPTPLCGQNRWAEKKQGPPSPDRMEKLQGWRILGATVHSFALVPISLIYYWFNMFDPLLAQHA